MFLFIMCVGLLLFDVVLPIMRDRQRIREQYKQDARAPLLVLLYKLDVRRSTLMPLCLVRHHRRNEFLQVWLSSKDAQ